MRSPQISGKSTNLRYWAVSESPTIRPEQLRENIRKPSDLLCRP